MASLRDSMPAVPANMVRIATAGMYDRSLDADRTIHAQAIGALHGYPLVTLSYVTRGYVPAGSAMRWDEARWRVTYTVSDGGIHGKSFLEGNEAEARAYFAALTDSQAVSARRQEDAMLEETVYAPARAQRAAEIAARAAAEKARKAARRAYLKSVRV